MSQRLRCLLILVFGVLLFVTLALAHQVSQEQSDDHPCVAIVYAQCWAPDIGEHVYIPPGPNTPYYITWGQARLWFVWHEGAHHKIRFRRDHNFRDRIGHGIYVNPPDSNYEATGPASIDVEDFPTRAIYPAEVQGWGYYCDAATRSCCVNKDDGPTPTVTDTHSFLLN